MIIKENRSESYLGTVNLKNEQDMKIVNVARKIVRDTNLFRKEKGNTKQMYVKLQGRGHRMGVWRYNQSLPLKFAETADIYIYERFSHE